jgi:tetratricopeptide (TPR) repeat protein
MQPWLEGRFSEAEQRFAQMRRTIPTTPQALLWEAEFEIERARFARAAALIKEAQSIGTWDSCWLPARRQAWLFFSVGQFADAQKLASEGGHWDGKDIAKLKVASPMNLVTLGEIASARGDFFTAIAILEKAETKSKTASSLYGLEWIRARNDIAIAEIGLGSYQDASQEAASALADAEREWGVSGVLAADARDTLGLAQMAESNFREAEVSLTRSRIQREALYEKNHPKIAESYIHAAALDVAQGQNADALRILQHGLQIERALTTESNGRWALALLTGAEIWAKTGHIGEATNCYASAIPVLERELGHDAPRLLNARKRYGELLGTSQ